MCCCPTQKRKLRMRGGDEIALDYRRAKRRGRASTRQRRARFKRSCRTDARVQQKARAGLRRIPRLYADFSFAVSTRSRRTTPVGLILATQTERSRTATCRGSSSAGSFAVSLGHLLALLAPAVFAPRAACKFSGRAASAAIFLLAALDDHYAADLFLRSCAGAVPRDMWRAFAIEWIAPRCERNKRPPSSSPARAGCAVRERGTMRLIRRRSRAGRCEVVDSSV